MKLQIVSNTDRGMTLAAWGTLFVVIVRDDLTVERLDSWQAHQVARFAEVNEKFNVLTLLDVTAEQVLRFSADARKASERITRENAHLLRCSAVVFGDDGFLASGVRSVIAAVNLFARSEFPMRVFRTVPQAVEWIVLHAEGTLPEGFDLAALTEGLERVRGG